MNSQNAEWIGLGVIVLGAAALAACASGGDAVKVPPAETPCEQAFLELGAQLGLCRTCHVSGGVADTPEGRGLLLSPSSSEDVAYLRASWQRLGHTDGGVSPILGVAAGTDGRTHSGGFPWPVGSQSYNRMAEVLRAFQDPSACATVISGDGGGAEGGALVPLLGTTHGGHVWNGFCEGKSDDTPLPVDPRTLVQPGTNTGKAAYFNAFWVDCHVGAPASDRAPTTCGDYRSRYARGKAIMEGGSMTFFGGEEPDSLLSEPASVYDNVWTAWGMSSRPTDLESYVENRWGVPPAPFRNPYPLPGENANATGGGTGQLPLALSQLRNSDGTYTGSVGFNCHWCHSSQVGLPSEGLGTVYGTNSNVDLGASFHDAWNGIGALAPIAANKVRGTGDILLYPAIVAVDFDRAAHYNASIVVAPSGGSVDFPTWWNNGHRTRRFHDGSFAMDDPRPVMGFFIPVLSQLHLADLAYGRNWIEEKDQDVQAWIESLESPEYPGPIDAGLAEAGAVLFHTKDLWAPGVDNPVPRPPGGNGSCANCHGVYSPRYAQDPAFLDGPELEGIAAYTVPLSIIGTDPARANSLNDGLKESLKWTWWAFGTNTTPGTCFGVTEEGGYLAPPLYGVWASAPYFHNGSVPSVWEVLKPADRREIWRRVSAPPPANDPNAFMGYDTSFARGYDQQKLGWKYDTLACGDPGTQPWLDCAPTSTVEIDPVQQQLFNGGFMTLWFTWNFTPTPTMTSTDLENRKAYNTHLYSQGNGGHEFTRVLTDEERWALVEYLKTL